MSFETTEKEVFMELEKIPENNLFKKFFKGFGILIKSMYMRIINFFSILKKGSFKTKLSFAIMGSGCVLNGQVIKGLIYLVIEAFYIVYMATFGLGYIKDITTLGTSSQYQVWNEKLQIYQNMPGDNSMLILLFSVLTIFITFAFITITPLSLGPEIENRLDYSS